MLTAIAIEPTRKVSSGVTDLPVEFCRSHGSVHLFRRSCCGELGKRKRCRDADEDCCRVERRGPWREDDDPHSEKANPEPCTWDLHR